MTHGRTEPRLWTPPLRELSPKTSYGYDLIDFADQVLGTPFDPWQKWLSVHVGELLPDDRPRFRHVLVLVARQNGKSLWGHALIQYWLFLEQIPLVLGTSTDRSYAKKAWTAICAQAKDNPYLSRKLGRDAQRLTIGEELLTTLDGAEYMFAANNGRAARSTTLHRWLCDELREHHSRETWDSAANAMTAVPDAQVVAISNQGGDDSVMIDALRQPALDYIATGEGDPRVGLFEWSSPDGAQPDDLDALAQANPNLVTRIDADALVAAGRRAMAAGGQELAGFRTESMCQRVNQLDPAIDPDHWAAGKDVAPMDGLRDRVALCVDVAIDGTHATLVAAAVQDDDRVRVEVVKAWSGVGCTTALRKELPGEVAKVKPRVFGFLPSGPAAVVAADLSDPEKRHGRRMAWPPRGVKVEEIKGEVTAVCMSLASLVEGRQIVHSDDPLLNQHVEAAEKLWQGDAWRFARRGAGPVDADYAMAGAVHLARTLPPSQPPLTVA